ncbi:MAG: ABC transporter permease [Limnochordaceae bacterium]|nr:ABC transporter permease [Limnochordaceae bacterium]
MGGLGRYLARRLLLLVPVILGITLVVFVLMNVVPGDPLYSLIDERSAGLDPAVAEAIRRQWGLDRPLYVQYVRFLANAIQGDLGRSFVSRQRVTEAVVERLGATLRLGLAALVVAVGVGLPAGIVAATRRGSAVDAASMVGAMAGVSMPVFWLGLLLMYLLAVSHRWLPPSGYGGGALRYLVLPALTLGLPVAAVVARIARSAMLEVLRREYVVTARAKGLPEGAVLVRHGLRNALIPIVTIVGVQAGGLLSGAVVTETIFNWPGVGRLLIDAIGRRDMPVVQGAVIFIAVLFALVNLIVDVTYAFIDPRVRYE